MSTSFSTLSPQAQPPLPKGLWLSSPPAGRTEELTVLAIENPVALSGLVGPTGLVGI